MGTTVDLGVQECVSHALTRHTVILVWMDFTDLDVKRIVLVTVKRAQVQLNVAFAGTAFMVKIAKACVLETVNHAKTELIVTLAKLVFTE